MKICVEVDLHEWIPDKTNQYKTSDEAFTLAKEFYENKVLYPNGQQLRWETLDEVRKRMQRVVEKYAGFGKVIFVGHSMAFGTLTNIDGMKPAEIIEWEYFKN